MFGFCIPLIFFEQWTLHSLHIICKVSVALLLILGATLITSVYHSFLERRISNQISKDLNDSLDLLPGP